MIIRSATILDIQYIVPLLEEHYGCDLMYGMELHLSAKIRDSFNNLIIINSDNTMVLFVEEWGTLSVSSISILFLKLGVGV